MIWFSPTSWPPALRHGAFLAHALAPGGIAILAGLLNTQSTGPIRPPPRRHGPGNIASSTALDDPDIAQAIIPTDIKDDSSFMSVGYRARDGGAAARKKRH